jgi:hypothetical protein
MARRSTRKAPQLSIEVRDLAAFMGTELEQTAAERALEQATAAAAAEIGAPVPEHPSHNLRQGILLLASQLLMAGADADDLPIPLTVRFYWRLHASAAA